tara:strand:+ start:460 stop:657 length:198 start_codon:yes stop_codon:yes gene_type:complete
MYVAVGICQPALILCQEVDMDIRIYSKNLDLHAEAESHIHKKFNTLKRHMNLMSDAKLEVARTSK